MSVIFDHNLGKVWKHQGGSAQGMLRRPHLGFLTASQRLLAERTRQARMLFEGAHREYFIGETRSSYEFKPIKDDTTPFYVPLNLLTLVSRKTADLLFGESARITIDNDWMQERIDQIVNRSWLNATLPAAATECSWCGFTYLDITRIAGEAMIGHVDADEVFPLGPQRPDYQFDRYVRYETATLETGGGRPERHLLLETHYAPGQIKRELYELTIDAGGMASRSAVRPPLSDWPMPADSAPLVAIEATGLSRPSLVYIPNGYAALSDYDGLIDPQDNVTAKHTQLARVIAKHSDPNIWAHESQADDEGQLRRAGVVWGRDKAMDKPEYILWDAEMAAAVDDRRFALLAFATLAEMPLSVLGIKDDSTAETGVKMRLNASPALAKVQRLASFWQGGIRLAVQLALEAERVILSGQTIGVEMRDGLPVDEAERADTIANLRSAGVMSRRRALEAQYLEPTDIDAELKELERESKQETPSVLLGEPPVAGTTATNFEQEAQDA